DENNNLAFINELESKIKSLNVENKSLDRFIDDSKIVADNDLALANSLKRSKAKVVLGYFFHMSQEGLGYEIEKDTIDAKLAQISESKYSIIQFSAGEHPDEETFFDAYAPETNLPILTDTADSSGYFNMFPDFDGVVRWIPFIIKSGDEIFPPLSMQSIWHYLDNPPLIVKVAEYGVEAIQIGDIRIPTDEKGRMMINYLGPPKTFPHYPISDIINNRIPKGEFKDKIVLVGATAIGIYDMRNAPFSPVYPG
ncbi:unnamed protein product, partial [marine sediment metagenome]